MRQKAPELPDLELWEEVAKTITPLHKHRPLKGAAKPAKPMMLKEPARPPAAMPPSPRITPPSPPPLASFDRRTSQKMLRGQAEIDARIDLHGLGLEMARFHLLEFLAHRRMQGARTVLVITGKGASPFSGHLLHGISQQDAPEREGKLRRALPRWLEEAAFRNHVIGFQPAHPRHGGGGAFYIRLRKWQG